MIDKEWKCINNIDKYSDVDFIYVSNFGEVYSTKKKDYLVQNKNNCGYYLVNLSKNRKATVHRLVALLFCDGYKEGYVVDHKDGTRDNNICSNLRWVTTSENNRNRQGDSKRSPKRPVKATNIKTGEVSIFDSYSKAQKFLGGTSSEIRRCCLGERRTSNGYKFEFAN